MTSEKLSPKKKPLIALFNYGGGMRGLIPAHFMQKIEETTGLQMSDMVDIFMGPSTGSILNAALTMPHPHEPTRPKFRARHMVRFYEREGIQIFPRDSFRSFRSMVHDFNNRTMRIGQLDALLRHGHYQHANLGRALRALFGRSKLSDSLASLIVPVYNIDGRFPEVIKDPTDTPDAPVHAATNFMREGGHALWLKNIRFDGAVNVRTPQDVNIYDAVMGSTAAPTYFPCHHFMMGKGGDAPRDHEIAAIDGSIFDNPCMSYLGALRRHVPADRELIIIVLGTGYSNRSIRKEDWNRYGSLGVVDPNNDMPLINIFFYASETALFETFTDEMGGNLHSFNKSLVTGPYAHDFPNTQIDDASPENLRRLKNFYEMMLEENRKKFDQICDILVKNYESRMQAHPEELAAQASLPSKLRHGLTRLGRRIKNTSG